MMAFLGLASLVLAAFFGVMLITYVWQGRRTPKLLAAVHGTFASIGIVLLIINAFVYHTLWISVVIFLLAAMGGIYLITNDLLWKKVPKSIATIHGLIALTGIFVLIISLFFYS